MRRYHTDRFGMISSFDIAEALRRAEMRQRDAERHARSKQARSQRPRSQTLLARVRALIAPPARAAA
jgi:hypothetical protein